MGGVAIKADIHPSLARPNGRSQMSGSIVILTGAGISKASGLETFSGDATIWTPLSVRDKEDKQDDARIL